MANRYIFQIALLLCITTALAESYTLDQSQQKSSILVCQDLLNQLNGSATDCLKQRMNSKIPEEIKNPQLLQKEDLVLVTYELFQQIFGIFSRNFSRTSWNETIVEKLLMELYQQKNQLKTTVEEIIKETNDIWGNKHILNLKKYYFSLMRYLKANKYSSCAWIIIKTEIIRNFVYLDKLISYFSN
ncbi:interferon beta [Erinaceus europaeus]|uniref:Interferon beta n=1 Tax=Erinaceus europaeus TaxID=9365 RepID=A0A1S3AJQ9_ERIEU|nr:interferon beta [Erinaceus europaeus]